jgi:hypothetical protein
MMLCFGIAKELGMSVSTVLTTMTTEEIIGWSAYFSILNDQQAKAMGR